jgi:hypothetical protein
MKNSSDTIGNRTRDLPTCSAVPQPTAALHVGDKFTFCLLDTRLKGSALQQQVLMDTGNYGFPLFRYCSIQLILQHIKTGHFTPSWATHQQAPSRLSHSNLGCDTAHPQAFHCYPYFHDINAGPFFRQAKTSFQILTRSQFPIHRSSYRRSTILWYSDTVVE